MLPGKHDYFAELSHSNSASIVNHQGTIMKKTAFSAAVLVLLAVMAQAQAQTAAPAPADAAPAAAPAATPEHTFTGNVAVVSDYRFRGISQSFRRPAVQGGFDYSHSSGFYVGNWNSSVSGNTYQNGSSLEMDLYGGYKFDVMKDVQGDVGLLYYYYPGASIGTTGQAYHNGEIYFSGTYKWFSAKYSYGLTDFFGLNATTAPVYAGTALNPNGGSKGSGYLDLNANFDIAEKTTLNLHVGRQTVSHYSALNYTDYKVGVSKDFGFATLGLALISTHANSDYWKVSNTAAPVETKKLGTSTAVLSLSKTF
jgi:uncharacterized protein (TIGR02001 family)